MQRGPVGRKAWDRQRRRPPRFTLGRVREAFPEEMVATLTFGEHFERQREGKGWSRWGKPQAQEGGLLEPGE